VIQRNTQTAEYWQAFELTSSDIEFVHGLMLEHETPMHARELALALVGERLRLEEAELRASLSQGTVYQPRKRFAIGEQVLFTSLDFRVGIVEDIRPGANPEYGEFDVITVDFGPDRRKRSFAAGLAAPHKLNADLSDLLTLGDSRTEEQILASEASDLPSRLAERLAAQPEFASYHQYWLPRDLMAEIHVGLLNIAEAAIEVRSSPVDTPTLIKEMDLPTEIRPEVLAFSLHSALQSDGRFDQVGPEDAPRWYLRRLEPAEALTVPAPLVYRPIAYDRDAPTVELMQLEWELDDEWSGSGDPHQSDLRATIPSTTVLLTYPHLVSGTLPLNKRSRSFFQLGDSERTMITLIDGRWGQQFSAWAVPSGRFIAGLRPWYEQHKLPAGAKITLERREDSNEVVVDFRPKRMRREWARWAQVVDSVHLDLQLRKQEIACEYDEEMIIGADRPEELLSLRARPEYANKPLSELVFDIFTDLAGLNQQGVVHAKTIYSAVNVILRCPPGPIFAILATDPRMQAAGDNRFRLKTGDEQA
jgi:hypothetical protein